MLVARLRHLTNAGQLADDLLARFQLTDAAKRRAAAYCGGMRRRLDIAMSLIGNPPVIFLDEPTTGLDPQARIEVWQAVRELAEHGTLTELKRLLPPAEIEYVEKQPTLEDIFLAYAFALVTYHRKIA